MLIYTISPEHLKKSGHTPQKHPLKKAESWVFADGEP